MTARPPDEYVYNGFYLSTRAQNDVLYPTSSKVDTPSPPLTEKQRDTFIDYDLYGMSSRDVRDRRVTQAGSMHPTQKRMTLTRMLITGANSKISSNLKDELVCHYNPESITKSIGANYYASLDTPGVRTERYVFKLGKATTWNMTLLFSTQGDEFRRRDDRCKNVKESLTWLEETIRPSKTFLWGERAGESTTAMEAPPPVFVNLFDDSFTAYIQQAQVKYLRCNPLTGAPIRAEIALTFLEYVNSSI